MVYLISNEPHSVAGWPQDKVATLQQMFDHFAMRESVAVDTETSGLSAFADGARLWSVQVGDADTQFVIDMEHITADEVKTLTRWLGTRELVIHNAAFDLPFLYRLGCTRVNVYDTYLAECVLTMGSLTAKRNLAAVAEQYLGVTLDKEQREHVRQGGLTTADDVLYAADDVRYLLDIKQAQYGRLNHLGLDRALRLENRFVAVLAYIEYCGIYIDREAWYRLVRRNEYYEYHHLLKLDAMAESLGVKIPDPNGTGEEEEEWSAGTEGRGATLWSSPQKVIEVFKSLGIDTTDPVTGKDTVNAKALSKVRDKHPIVGLYLDYKEWEKAVNTYGRNWFDYIMPDRRIHTKYKSMVDTGRTSCGDAASGPFPNVQNLPSDPQLRACFRAQTANHTLVIADYSSQESILMAEMSGEPNLLNFFTSGGGDIYSYTAQKVWPELQSVPVDQIKTLHPDKRAAAKAAVFAIQYGGSGETIAENMNISAKEGRAIYDAYFQQFPMLKRYFDTAFATSIRDGYITINPVTKRKRFVDNLQELKKIYSDHIFWDTYWASKKTGGQFYNKHLTTVKRYHKMKAAVYKMALNTPIQGTAADMSKIAGVLLLDYIIEKKLWGKVKIVNFVHDEYVVECPRGMAEEVAAKMKEVMEKAAAMFVKRLKIKVEPVISNYWKK